jgi:hypothetical protein
MGGYQEAQVGISFTLGGEAWGVGDFWGYWAVERSKSTQWSEDDRLMSLGKTVMRIQKLLEDAKVQTVEDLKGIPVRVHFDGNTLKDWEVLKEVL